MRRKFNNKLLHFVIPKYDEVTLFTLSILFLIIIFLNPEQFKRMGLSALEDFDIRIIIVAILFVFGWAQSIYHVFIKRKKSKAEKYIILFYVIVLNLIISMQTFSYVIESTKNLALIILPAINLIQSIILLLMYRMRRIDESSISDENAKRIEVAIALITSVSIILFCQFILNYYWAISFSIAIFYTTMILKAFSKFRFNRKKI